MHRQALSESFLEELKPKVKGFYFTASFKAFPGMNLGTFLAGILISLPV